METVDVVPLFIFCWCYEHCTSETFMILSISVSDISDRHLATPTYRSTSLS